MRLLCLPLSCVTSPQPHVAQATQIDMLVGSVANGLNSSGGFCAGTRIVVDHQRINGTSFVYSAAVPRSSRSPPRRASTSCGTRRRSSARCRRTCARSGPCSTASRWSRSPHTRPRRSSTSTYDAVPVREAAEPRDPCAPRCTVFDIAGEEHLLQDIMDEALAQGVWITRARRLRGQELVEALPSIRLAVTAALSRKEGERSARVIKAAVAKVLAKRK